ncbi:DUF1345 domain-containing protein [Streptomyces hydrogenans]|uniref:DUF1345 domain-containing protein n=1 Tax=Streptomyces hydrogenans TaxID=1873719 RepID=UPI0035DC30F0
MDSWLSERPRSTVSWIVAGCTAALFLLVLDDPERFSAADVGVIVLFAYLFTYLAVTLTAFSTAEPEAIHAWAGRREERGTVLQRYVLGSAPGPGVSLSIGAAALLVAVVWRPGHLGSHLPEAVRVTIALALVVTAWVTVLTAFAVCFHADNIVEDEQALDFPGDGPALWADYVYFALSVMTTFGTTDVDVTSREMRRTVSANAIIAFVFNTVTVASLVGALDAG